MDEAVVPVVVFAYARPEFLARTLAALEREQVPLVYVYCDGPRSAQERSLTEAVHAVARSESSFERIVFARRDNWGLGRSILAGVTEVLGKHPWAIVLEDDLEFVSGTYRYFCDGLKRYRDEPRVMSITGWTHPRITPSGLETEVYFDGRCESWSFATWARAWHGMGDSALVKYTLCESNGVDPYRYGKDLVAMARTEARRNLWAVRFAYHHLLNDGLCLRPRHSLVNHVGFDTFATNAPNTRHWLNVELPTKAPEIEQWPEALEAAECPALWQRASGSKPNAVERLRDNVYTSIARSPVLTRLHATLRNLRSG